MPIYEYQCKACGFEFEEWQKMSDSPVRTCPSCRKRKVERLVSLSSFHLKGSGWYVTDYRGKNSGSSVHKDDAEGPSKTSESDSSSGKTAAQKGENKSEGKSEGKGDKKASAKAE